MFGSLLDAEIFERIYYICLIALYTNPGDLTSPNKKKSHKSVSTFFRLQMLYQN